MPISAAALEKRIRHVLEDPRGFVEAEQFAGPDRRRAFFAAFDVYDLMNRIDAGAHFHDTISEAAEATPSPSSFVAVTVNV